MAVRKRGVCKWGILKHPVFNVLKFRGWIKYIFDNNFVINELNPTSEVQNMGKRAFQNAPFANGRFPKSDYNCLWALYAPQTLGTIQWLSEQMEYP